jgi:hypothetical protein
VLPFAIQFREPPMRFAFRIKTKSGGIVGNIVIEAKDVEAAKVKLYKRYPDCQILNVETK